jgi:outer membrane protein
MKRLLLSAVAVFVLFSASAMAQNLKIGIVDIQTIVAEMPAAKKADEDLNALGQRYQDTAMKMQKELETRLAAYQKQQAMMPEDQRQQEEQALQMLNQEATQYYQIHFGPTGTIAMKREQMLEPIRKAVQDAIAKVAKSEKISLVLDKNQQYVLYNEDKMDITFRVLDEIKRGAK